ncbi:MAG TPA: hypothetical protein VIN61_15425 [Gammaproteobacteria bacterium]
MIGRRIATWLLAAPLAGCGAPEDPAAAIHELVAAAERAAEARDTSFFRDHVAAGYRDARGNDRDALINLIRGYFLTHPRIEVVSRVSEVVLHGDDAATVTVRAALVGRRDGEPLLTGLDGDLHRFEIDLVLDGGEWQVIRAEWDRPRGD